MVALVGAGPSDRKLLTLRGKELIEQANVLVFDRLVDKDILELANSNCKMIDVGKVSGNHSVPQDEINQILLKEALQNDLVVRLKGGDPFLFGRGAEELELLVENNIKYEIVSGVTSAISAPAFAGIPVTHRDYASSLHIITGHKKKNEVLDIDFELYSKIDGTLVFLMGLSSIDYIISNLIENGKDINTPVAVVENGTRDNQRQVLGVLDNIIQKTKNNEIKSPAVIIVGDVCSVMTKYNWFGVTL